MEVILLNIKNIGCQSLLSFLVIVIFLLVTFAKANEGLDKYEQDELKLENSNIFQKGQAKYEYI